ncbi:MAG: ribosome small subunit-dependent GTPase A, partial [Cyclobacteriaceae bacterium]|nr:ribosome small subunit-dependent GTPase A [Cyclobacteriaceae bacterium HetDA_MAG_MS6]
TNLDQVVVVQGLDQEFNLNRLERYLVQITICRIKPIVILNKCDLIEDQVFYRESIRRLQRNIQPYFCSTTTGEGVEVLAEEVFTKGTTSALIGSSGVGKSSLTNALQNHKSRSVGSVSHATGKGRHITTTRDLILLDNGSIIIDTPGMREFGVGYEEDGDFATQFPAIDRLAKDCRYLDCAHIREKGCAVIEAYQTGDLDPLIYDNYLKLYKEQERFQLSKHEQNRQGKRFGKMVKEVKHFKRKYKS